MPRKISPQELNRSLGADRRPLIVDVRRADAFAASPVRIAGALWRDHMTSGEWLPRLPAAPIVVYCTHGHNVSEIAAAHLAAAGADVAMLEGGMEGWLAAGGPVVSNAARGIDPLSEGPSVWVTRARPKIDRIACPWLIRRFVDPLAIFHFVSAEWVKDIAEETGAVPFDIEGVFYSHRDDGCTFDTMVEEFGLGDPALLHLARIVRAADTARLDMEPQAAGLLAVSLGLSAVEDDDRRQLERAMTLYDGLFGWCRFATTETHNWPAKAA